MTKQETFNKIVTHLRKQGGPAVNANGQCRYRGLNGAQCAAGCLILDEHYNERLEGLLVDTSGIGAVSRALTASGVSSESILVVALMQYVHDTGANMLRHPTVCANFCWANYIEEQSAAVAKRHDLTMPEAV